ncbi:hypothetical protein SKAU_G00303460 [Synaphobranchus kaupii]|uniref:Vitellogenin domain-containing protein n=1 Tax=Synaphobranchus kaupii TaxID=118154 RepID=A0A9Q1INH8_SYNKA|nr:hypothetical protein SKAU_G00303460 [Synaphobranchus kaupii]
MLKLALIFLCALSSSVSASAKGGPRLGGGQLHKYRYSTEVLLDRARRSAGGSAGYRISSAVDISLAWRNPSSRDHQLLRVTISDVKIESATPRPDKDNIFLDTPTQRILGTANLAALERPFLVHLKLGKVKGLYSYQNELTAIRNLKRGVAGLLQLQLTSGKTQEVDASGRCMVQYTAGTDHVTRVKAVDTCKTLETGFSTHSQVLGVSGKSSSVTEFTLEDGFVKTRRFRGDARPVRQHPQLCRRQSRVQTNFDTEKVKTKCRTCPTLWEYWQGMRKQFEPENLSKADASRGFLSLIHIIRKATKEGHPQKAVLVTSA